ncbi:MAG TPA: CHRD domain-containing protein [Planctomycetota bacterium]|nr:CHRD domain-containing protein [Planctomycetota bacterium]
MRFVVSAILAAALAASAAAQTSFYADIDGTKETPANGSTAGGWAKVTLNPDNTLTYEVRTWGLTATQAHIHDGPIGVAGSIIVPLTGGPTAWSGTSAAITAAQVTKLQTLGLYVNVHTSAFPGGEIRGQLEARPRVFGAFLNAAQETPPGTSTNKGVGSFSVDLATNDLSYNVSWTGTATAAHIHDGPVGVAGGINIPLIGGPTSWVNVAGGIDVATFTGLQSLGEYANIHSASKPAGEVRGQIVASGIKYGDTALIPVDLDVTGAPVSGGTMTVVISGGTPGGLVTVLGALGPGAGLVKGQPFLLDAGSLILSGVLLPLDGSGSLSLPVVNADLGVTADIFLQVFDISGGPVEASNGVRLPLVDLPF